MGLEDLNILWSTGLRGVGLVGVKARGMRSKSCGSGWGEGPGGEALEDIQLCSCLLALSEFCVLSEQRQRKMTFLMECHLSIANTGKCTVKYKLHYHCVILPILWE